MTELACQLLTLPALYGTVRQRSERVEAVRQRVERLPGQRICLEEGYRMLAVTLRGRLS